jgi:hypothetical protein
MSKKLNFARLQQCIVSASAGIMVFVAIQGTAWRLSDGAFAQSAPAARHLSERNKWGLLSNIPKERHIRILFQPTEPDAGPLANEIYEFLRQAGYTVVDKPIAGFLATPKGGRGVTVDLETGHPDRPAEIFIGSPQ